jgi:hypothetical protein
LGDRPSGLYTGDSMMSAPCLLARDRVVLAPVAATGTAAAAPLPVAMAMAGPGPGPAATMAGGGYAPAPANGACTLHWLQQQPWLRKRLQQQPWPHQQPWRPDDYP